jgi:hypothetical protein
MTQLNVKEATTCSHSRPDYPSGAPECIVVFMTRVAQSLVAVDLNFIIFRGFVLSCIGCPSSIYGF